MILLSVESWEVKPAKNRGKGLFAKENIPAGKVIGDYLGMVLKNTELNTNDNAASFYLMYYHDKASIYPDLNKADLHLVNHSCEPNSGVYIYQGHSLFFARRYIFKGEEITISYMLPPQDEFCKPCLHVCRCESRTCRETMHLTSDRYAKWKSFLATLASKSKRKRIAYNKQLKKLAVYPESIPDDSIYDLFGNPDKPGYVCEEKELLPLRKLRKLIRETGQTLEFPQFNQKVYRIVNGKPFIGKLHSH